MDPRPTAAARPDPAAAREQPILPLRTAFDICLRGLRTRLGRSVITLTGVVLGIAFSMSVLCGFHIKDVMRAETEAELEAARRVAVLRGEAGRLRERAFRVAGDGPAAADRRFLAALAKQGAVLAPPAPAGPAADLLVLDPAGAPPAVLAASAPRGARVYLFAPPPPALAAALREGGAEVRVLDAAPPAGEAGRLEARRGEERARMLWVLGISLLVTVGGISNALLMSVTERFREIATMKCLGALSGFVVKLFLIESSLVGFAGSLLGAAAGLLFAVLAYSFRFGLGPLLGAIRFGQVGLYAAACVAGGVALAVVAGLYPARVAARMIPADALRSQV